MGKPQKPGGGLFATGKAIKNFFKHNLVIESELKIDYGAQIAVEGKALGSKTGVSLEKESGLF